MRGKLIVLTAPSGTGKTTIVKRLLDYFDNLEFSVSACSRDKRKGEIDGENYYFISKEEFKNKIETGEFVEFEEVYKDHFYGTLKSEVDKKLDIGKNIIFDIDVKGAINIQKKFHSNCLSIFLKPPSIIELKKRLKKRGTEDAKSIEFRLDKAKEEMRSMGSFDFVVINSNLEKAFEQTKEIIQNFFN